MNSKAATWIGYALSALVILFMIFDGTIKLVPIDAVTESSAALGLPTSIAFARGLGILGLVCTALYAFPRTSLLGAVLLTGYYGATVRSSAICCSASISASWPGAGFTCATKNCGRCSPFAIEGLRCAAQVIAPVSSR
jgi:hypothetical protein